MLSFSRLFFISFIVSFAIASCAPKPYADTNKQYKKQARMLAKEISQAPPEKAYSTDTPIPGQFIGTINFGLRKPNAVIIHHTAQNSCEQTLKTFTTVKSQVSAHYVICKDGTVHHMLNDYLRAWHAGAGKWGGQTDINSSSIGIEIDNNGFETFTPAQLSSLLGLLENLKKTYNIPVANFIGHGDIAPTRKVDPNVNFPWNTLAEKGFGLWYGDTTGLVVPPDFNPLYALRIVGYDISNAIAATQAFRRHFLFTEVKGELMEPEKKVLFSLMQKFL